MPPLPPPPLPTPPLLLPPPLAGALPCAAFGWLLLPLLPKRVTAPCTESSTLL